MARGDVEVTVTSPTVDLLTIIAQPAEQLGTIPLGCDAARVVPVGGTYCVEIRVNGTYLIVSVPMPQS